MAQLYNSNCFMPNPTDVPSNLKIISSVGIEEYSSPFKWKSKVSFPYLKVYQKVGFYWTHWYHFKLNFISNMVVEVT